MKLSCAEAIVKYHEDFEAGDEEFFLFSDETGEVTHVFYRDDEDPTQVALHTVAESDAGIVNDVVTFSKDEVQAMIYYLAKYVN